MKMQVVREIAINGSIEKVYNVIGDLSKWNMWSPWYHTEPTCKTELTGSPFKVGQSQSWSGEVIGSGRMTIMELTPNQKVKMKIEFLTPWKSVADVVFDVQSLGANQSKLIWNMDSQLPIFMFFFKNMMAAFIGSDFTRGLNMAKEFVETGAVVTKSIFNGEKEMGDFVVIGKRTKGSITSIGKDIRADLEQMNARLQKGEFPQPEFVVTLSHDHNIPKGTTEFTAGYAYKKDRLAKIPSDLEMFQIPMHKAMMIDHYGPYRNIGNAWSMAVTYQRGKKMKLNKKIPMYEVYKTMPGGAEKDIHTQVVMPIK